jgi:hypothetical protein
MDKESLLHSEDDDLSLPSSSMERDPRDFSGKSRHASPPGFLRRTCSLQSQWRWALDTGLLLLILVLLLRLHEQSSGTNGGVFAAREIGSDLTGVTPKFGQQIVQFRRDEGYMPQNTSEFFTQQTKQKWLDLVPKGLGYQVVEDPEKYNNLPTPLPEYKAKTVFTTSITHQLHCLYALAQVYASYSSNPQQVPVDTRWHLPHCIDYLRQSIMCAGDVALEGTQTTFPDGVEGSDGWDAKHVCRDYRQVYNHLEKTRVNDLIWI